VLGIGGVGVVAGVVLLAAANRHTEGR
jgi:hypothetical protein